jgi:hypothetical protein
MLNKSINTKRVKYIISGTANANLFAEKGLGQKHRTSFLIKFKPWGRPRGHFNTLYALGEPPICHFDCRNGLWERPICRFHC